LNAIVSSPAELEAQANRVRGQVGDTLDALRSRLTPRNLIDEMADRSGVREITPSSMFDFAVGRHPMITAAAGVGVGLCAFLAFRSSSASGPGIIRQTIGDLSQSTKKSLKSRVEAKRGEFMRAAETHLSAGVEQLSDAVEKGVGELVSRSPAPNEAKPLIESAIQIILIAAFESLLNRRRK